MDSNLIVGILVIVVLIGGLLAIGQWLTARQKKEVWSGEVVKKWISKNTDEDGDTTTINYVEFMLDGSGKKKRVGLPGALYNSLEPGNKVEKRAGELDPVKV